MDQLLNPSKKASAIVNPFQHQMGSQGRDHLNMDIFESPLPLSSARDDPALLSSFSGVFHTAWPTLRVIALEGPATITQLETRPWLSLIYVAAGEISFHQQNALVCCSAGDCFFIPQSAALWKSSSYSVVCLSLGPEQVLASLQSLRAEELGLGSIREWDLSKPSCMRANDGRIEASMLTTLYHLLTITSELAMNNPHLETHLGVTNQLSFLMALTACPDLGKALAAERPEAKNGGIDEAINGLTHYMTTHLSETMNLTSLEQYSHYSRRSLQYAFRQRFGCTITQWIRSKRLDLAFQRLKTAKIGESVSSIAHACGYRSSSLFSIEFQNRFHVKPSVLLREHQA
jgi:AraC-like DNA-binding protein